MNLQTTEIGMRIGLGAQPRFSCHAVADDPAKGYSGRTIFSNSPIGKAPSARERS